MRQRTHVQPKPKARWVIPIEVLLGKGSVSRALEAVAGMWADRADIDPVTWQRHIRQEWSREAKTTRGRGKRVRARRS